MQPTKPVIFITACCLIAVGCAIALACTAISQSIEINRYEAILDTSCKYSLDVAGCKSGIEMLKKMSIEDIEKWGY